MDVTLSSNVSLEMFVLSLKECSKGFSFSLKDFLVKNLVSRCRQYASEVVKLCFYKPWSFYNDNFL